MHNTPVGLSLSLSLPPALHRWQNARAWRCCIYISLNLSQSSYKTHMPVNVKISYTNNDATVSGCVWFVYAKCSTINNIHSVWIYKTFGKAVADCCCLLAGFACLSSNRSYERTRAHTHTPVYTCAFQISSFVLCCVVLMVGIICVCCRSGYRKFFNFYFSRLHTPNAYTHSGPIQSVC